MRPRTRRSDKETTRSGPAVRTRIILVILALTAAALTASGGFAYVLASATTDNRIDQELRDEAEHLHRMAAERINPVTGAAFRTPEEVVVAAIQLKALSPHEGVLGLRVDGTTLVSQQLVPVRLESDPELLRTVTPLVTGDTVLRTVRTPVTEYRVLVAPVTLPASAEAAPETAAFVLAVDRTAEQARTAHAFRMFAWVALAAVVLIGAVGWLMTGRLLAPIRSIARVARATEGADLSARIPVSGNDDLSDLSRAFNAMLDRLEAAFESQRQLLDDVGHEMRTPLTIVRGNLEVMDPTDPTDTEATRAIVLDELDRMNRLVEDLTTLASSARPDFVLPSPSDIGRLTHDVLDKAVALGDRTWTLSRRAEGVVVVDPQRLTQAWLQLAANAVKFSEPGSAVTIGSDLADVDQRGRGQLRLWVRDDGIGIPPEEIDHVFDRFERGSASRGREGSGLGLAIVQATAQGHGGTTTVVSSPGIGSTFTLCLPVQVVPEPGSDGTTP